MSLKGKKGTEKPIEIFITLFLILAVAIIMVKMFNSQITGKQEDLAKETQEAGREQAVEGTMVDCEQLCADAKQQSCSPQSVAAYCTKRVGEQREDVKNLAVDLNGDAEIGVDMDSLGGIGICEDAVYCPLITSCRCGRELDMKHCAKELCDYWNKQGLDADNRLATRFENPTPACKQDPDYNKSVMWFNDFPHNCSQFI